MSAVVATIGSATRSEGTLNEMFEAGMTAARFDLSFGDISYHTQSLELVHNAATKANRLCSMILDLGDKDCHVVQPFRVDENGWHQCTQRIRISRGQHVTLTASGDLYIPEVRSGTSAGFAVTCKECGYVHVQVCGSPRPVISPARGRSCWALVVSCR